MKTLALYAFAAVAEIGGCFAFWAWWRLEKSALWLIPGVGSLILFAWALALVDQAAAGRTYAAYGGIYILASIAWLWGVEGVRPVLTDWAGAGLCLAGVAVILFGAPKV